MPLICPTCQVFGPNRRLRRPPATLHGVVFDIFGGSRGDPARRHRSGRRVGFFRLLLKSWVLVCKDRKYLIFQSGLTDTLSAITRFCAPSYDRCKDDTFDSRIRGHGIQVWLQRDSAGTQGALVVDSGELGPFPARSLIRSCARVVRSVAICMISSNPESRNECKRHHAHPEQESAQQVSGSKVSFAGRRRVSVGGGGFT